MERYGVGTRGQDGVTKIIQTVGKRGEAVEVAIDYALNVGAFGGVRWTPEGEVPPHTFAQSFRAFHSNDPGSSFEDIYYWRIEE